MHVPEKDWKYTDFIEHILTNTEAVFGGPKRRWLKLYYVYMNELALEKLHKTQKPQKLGDFLKFEFVYTESISQKTKHVPYYMTEIEPNLFCFFTSSTREGYEKTLRKIIRKTRGMSEMWIRPEIFEKVKDFVTETEKTKVEGFLSVSSANEQAEARVRPHVKRRIRYRGSDGIDAIDELKLWYGVSPISLDFSHKKNKFQITNEGLFTLKHPRTEVFEIIDGVIELIREEQIKQKDVALKLKFETKQQDHINTGY